MYNVVFTPNAEADLGRLSARDVQRVIKKTAMVSREL